MSKALSQTSDAREFAPRVIYARTVTFVAELALRPLRPLSSSFPDQGVSAHRPTHGLARARLRRVVRATPDLVFHRVIPSVQSGEGGTAGLRDSGNQSLTLFRRLAVWAGPARASTG